MRTIPFAAGALPALLRSTGGIATLKTNNLCCSAAGITALPQAATGALIPHEKLREAALNNATLNAQEALPAQPVVGYTHTSGNVECLPQEKDNQAKLARGDV